MKPPNITGSRCIIYIVVIVHITNMRYTQKYMKIHVPSMLAKAIKHNQKTNITNKQPEFIKHNSHNGLEPATMALKILKQPPCLRKITISHNGLENKQPQWLRKFEVKKEVPSLESWEWWVKDL